MNKKNDGCAALSEQIFSAYRSRIYGYIHSKGVPFSDRDDIFSEIISKALVYEARYDSEKCSLSTWIYMICRSVVVNYFKKQRPEQPLDEALPSDFKLEYGIEYEAQLQELAQSLSRLPERERKIIVLRFYRDMEYGGIAKAMNLTETNVRKICARAIGKLKESMTGGD
ncbi:MAG: sigma-70 family RNA polymerase sigma factor [Oscillospiraceae bacterium]|nr:sigma-70 family RNA polymerase sigma factor [Oscillospiraceae bacterium]